MHMYMLILNDTVHYINIYRQKREHKQHTSYCYITKINH